MNGGLSKIAVLGGGAWGVALAMNAARAGRDVRLWARDPDAVAALHKRRSRYLPDIRIAEDVNATTDLAQAASEANVILVVTPAQSLRGVLEGAAESIAKGMPLVICAKGIEQDTGKLLSEVAGEVMPDNPVAMLSGPSFAADVARGLPTAVVVAAAEGSLAAMIAQALSTSSFRCYSTSDLTGVELGGALKNVFAIAAGAVTGAGLGASAQAAMVTRGFVELRRLAQTFGARSETLMGLSGLGDLMLSCGSSKSRNFAYGVALGKGVSRVGLPLAEGVATTAIATRLALERKIDAPIIAAVDALIAERMTIQQAVAALMTRPLRNEEG